MDRIQQARELIGQGKGDAARAVLQRVLQGSPRDPHANNLMSVVLARQGDLPKAVYFAQRAMEAAPGDARLLVTLGNLLCLNGRHAEGIPVLHRAIRVAPEDPEPRISLVKGHFGAKDFEGGAEAARAALEAGVEHPELDQLRSAALVSMGRLDEGVGVLRAALAREPEQPMTLSHLAFVSNYLPDLPPEELFAVHQKYGRYLAEHLEPLPGPPPRAMPKERLRVAFLSADLRLHPISFFIEPLLEHLDPERFELLAYYTAQKSDPVTARLKPRFSLWREVPVMPPHELAGLMRADRVDIAIDLAGHSEAHRLAALSLRAAPLQVTYLGYANTTGVEEIDARIVDSLTDPPGAEVLATERLVRLDPCFLCYRPPGDAPAVAPRGADNPITLGSFSAMPKINDPVLRLWGRVLGAIPGSRLMIKNQMAASIRARLEGVLGIGPERLLTPPWRESTREHLSTYAEVDIALDPFPYNGTTTTCEALFMGVPTVTLPGRTHASRVGLSLLTNTGLSTLVARDGEHFVALVRALAQDRGALAALRAGLRERFLSSPVCDGRMYARRFGAALEELWAERCRGWA